MGTIAVRRAVMEDIPDIMRFIDEHWKKDHIIAKNRSFFEWMFVDGNQCNFMIGKEEEENKIYGIMGFLFYNSTKTPDISGSIWKVIKSSNPMLGMDLVAELKRLVDYRYSCASGLSRKSMRIEEIKGGIGDHLRHYYRLGRRDSYEIAVVKDGRISPVEQNGCTLKQVNSFLEFYSILEEEHLKQMVPYKDKKYLEHRYFNHPIYHYTIWAVVRPDGTARSVLVGREVTHGNASILKLVDFIGYDEDMGLIGYALDKLIKEQQYEYVDLYCYGILDSIMEKAGFRLREGQDQNIIPNYFEPFLQENVQINFIHFAKKFHLYRGDGDQDRPNQNVPVT